MPGICRAESIVLLKPTHSWSVSGKDDVAQLKRLASGVGWEFEVNDDTTARLKALGMRTLRCINVDPLEGNFDEKGDYHVVAPKGYNYVDRLGSHLATCRAIGANPHIIIGQSILPELQLTAEDLPESKRGLLGNQNSRAVFGPKDWDKFQRYIEAVFQYVLIEQKFPDAEFEVGNEPAGEGNVVCPAPPTPASGSRAGYEAYFNLYRNIALAAERFEKNHPGLRVRLGGPATAWPFTFRFGDFNWEERFLRDCAEQKVKLDFLGLHYYGNLSSLDGEYPATYPSFTEMLRRTRAARDRYCPGLPIWFTEWGPSYITDNSEPSAINGNHVGAAWTAAFLNTLLQCGVDGALYLVTSDLRQQAADGAWANVWGWPSLCVSASALGRAYPKAPAHVFDMISRLEGTRVEATRGSGTVNAIASADPEKKRVTVMVWNYGCRIPEGGLPVDYSVREAVTVRVREADAFFGASALRARRWLVSETVSNAYYLYRQYGQVDARAELRQVDDATMAVVDGLADIGFAMPPSSVSFLDIEAAAGEPSAAAPPEAPRAPATVAWTRGSNSPR